MEDNSILNMIVLASKGYNAIKKTQCNSRKMLRRRHKGCFDVRQVKRLRQVKRQVKSY